MARTLFFIEAVAFAALAIVFPIIASDAAAAFILPVALSLILPLSCVMAVWPPRAVCRALRAAFTPRKPEREEAETYSRILESIGYFSRPAAALGLLFAVAAVCGLAPPARVPFGSGIRTLSLLGAYLAAYALLNAALWHVLAEVVGHLVITSPAGESVDFAAAYGLTPREWETAALIARGSSYKEVAYALGISIKTVKAHMSSVYEKTGAASNVGLALLLKDDRLPSTKVQ
jgi:DNA-binding CsgD family transcriptional regulator